MRYGRFAALAIGAAVVLLLGTAACGDSGPDTGPTFTMTVSGDVSLTVEASGAIFGETIEPLSELPVWILSLTAGEPGEVDGVGFVRRGGPPAEGSYALKPFSGAADHLAPGDIGAVLVISASADGTRAFIGSTASGSLTLTTATTTSMRGSFNFTAEGLVFFPGQDRQPENGTVTASGEFAAVPGDVSY
jgi:hypothetical protein